MVVPTLIPYLPELGRATGSAAIVAPGGGFVMLSMDSEGTMAAEWLRDRGIAAFVLKYRLAHSGETMADFAERVAAVFAPVHNGESVAAAIADVDRGAAALALADAQRAISLLRSRAAEWEIDPAMIGMIGFSAGGFLATNATRAHDPAERPDFVASIYGGYAQGRPAPDTAPPLFTVVTADDQLCFEETIRLVQAWRAAGRPVEAHIYPEGGHGFGLTSTGHAVDGWPHLLEDWLTALGHLG
ncbi:alpha/beta hydrolase [Actinomadura barringtoniae]|uniref:Alpha/beta hydrolase n=1 Tax=Actinomadura barringtoniae TaxID=1427535 RepID=A0A939PFC8_9ACTN|nr:alpha/beta hydrolase [Actinomadura barringtoniae]MBO2448694.1 alpha/beta hydrolase [Actinomadura barringtoniae]